MGVAVSGQTEERARRHRGKISRTGITAWLKAHLWQIVAVSALLVGLLLPAALWPTLPDGGRDAADERCAEPKATDAAPELPAEVELQTNEARPTLAIALADRQTADDSIIFATKDRKRLEDTNRLSVSAALLEFPRRTPVEPFSGLVSPKAEPEVGQTIIRLTICVDRGARFRPAPSKEPFAFTGPGSPTSTTPS